MIAIIDLNLKIKFNSISYFFINNTYGYLNVKPDCLRYTG